MTSQEGQLTLLMFLPCWDPTERDVSRTDRTNKFYEGPENPGLGLLNDILLTYCMYHFDLGERRPDGGGGGALGAQGVAADPVSPGYVQGMSDLLSPILFVVQNEVDAFWCFCGFMELVVRRRGRGRACRGRPPRRPVSPLLSHSLLCLAAWEL